MHNTVLLQYNIIVIYSLMYNTYYIYTLQLLRFIIHIVKHSRNHRKLQKNEKGILYTTV